MFTRKKKIKKNHSRSSSQLFLCAELMYVALIHVSSGFGSIVLVCKKVIVLVFFFSTFFSFLSSWGQFFGSMEAGSEDRSWILCGATVGRDINGREESFARTNLARPPMLFGTVRDCDDIAPSEIELAALLCGEVV